MTLDAIRGVAALCVVWLHWAVPVGVFKPPAAGLAVDLFFQLSGFVLCHNYEQRFQNGLTWSRFAVIRLVRLAPLNLLGCGIVLIAVILNRYGAPDWSMPQAAYILVSGAAFLPVPQSIGDDPILYLFPHNFPVWSLFFELFVNLVYVLISASLTTRRLIALIAISAVAQIGATAYFNTFETGATWITFLGGFSRVMFGFFLGVLLYRTRHIAAPRGVNTPLLLVGLFLILIGSRSPIYAEIVTFFIFPLLIIVAARTEPKSGSLQTFYLALGGLSYSIYILHIPLRMLFMSILEWFSMVEVVHFGKLRGGLALIALVLISMWADTVYDRRAREWLKQRLR
jgi:peptidoglycan/LPS O-acetylase OafA/YrhL